MLEGANRKILSGRPPRSNEVSVYKQLLENRDYGHVVEQMFPLIHPSMVGGGDVAGADRLNNAIKNFLLFSEHFTPEISTQEDNIRFITLLGNNENSITFMTAYNNFRQLIIDIKELFDADNFPTNLPESYRQIISTRVQPIQVGGVYPERNIMQRQVRSVNPPLEQILDLYDLLENIGGISSTFVMNDFNELKDELIRKEHPIILNYNWFLAFRLINVFIPCSKSIYYCKHLNPHVRLRSFEENINAVETTVEQIKNIYSSQLSSFTTYNKSNEPDAVENIENQLYGDSFNYYATDTYTYVPTESSFFLTLLLSLYFDGINYVIDDEYIYGIYGNYFLEKNINYFDFETVYELSQGLGLQNSPVDNIYKILTTLNTLKDNYILKNDSIELGIGKVNHAKLLLNYYILLVFTLLTNRTLGIVSRQLDNVPDWKNNIVRIITTIDTLIYKNIKTNIPHIVDLNIQPFIIPGEVRELFRGGKKKKTRRKNLKKRKKSKKIRVKKHKKTKKRVIKKHKKTRKNKK